jgi:sugar/nucleoside kinase (ribokinase family)
VTLKGNRLELARAAVAHELGCDSPAKAALVFAKRNERNVYVTQGDDGILAARPDGSTAHAAGIPVAGPLDIVGAGDSATSGIVAALLAGASAAEAAEIGNLVASITIQQLGTTGTATPAQVRARNAERPA